eukprot:PhF_6_TR27123/c0_g1_i5/m.39534
MKQNKKDSHQKIILIIGFTALIGIFILFNYNSSGSETTSSEQQEKKSLQKQNSIVLRVGETEVSTPPPILTQAPPPFTTTTTQIDNVMPPAPRRQSQIETSMRPIGTNNTCPHLDSFRKIQMLIPSDIQMLLGILGAYVDDVNSVVELGSRHGRSTAIILQSAPPRYVTVDLFITGPVSSLRKHGQKCRPWSNPDDYFAVQGNDLGIPIPFADTKFDVLFLDTLHASYHLEKELKLYPQHVKRYMIFHDSISFRTVDEKYEGIIENRTEKTKSWRGLHVAFEDFLRSNRDEWVEAMSYTHNNGLYVLRRRSYIPTLSHMVSSQERPIENYYENHVTVDFAARIAKRGKKCEEIGHRIGIRNILVDGYFLCGFFHGYTKGSPLHDSYVKLLIGNNVLNRQLPVIYGHAVAVNSIRVTSCTTSVLVAVLHAALAYSHTVYLPVDFKTSCEGPMKVIRRQMKKSLLLDNETYVRYDDKTEVDLLVAESGSKQGGRGFSNVGAFVLEFGTSVTPSIRGTDPSFVLHDVLLQKPGIAVWKKASSDKFNYVQG